MRQRAGPRAGKHASRWCYADAHPGRWPSVVMAPHSGQTRWAQQAASPPAEGSAAARWRSSPARTAAWLWLTSRVAVSRVRGPRRPARSGAPGQPGPHRGRVPRCNGGRIRRISPGHARTRCEVRWTARRPSPTRPAGPRPCGARAATACPPARVFRPGLQAGHTPGGRGCLASSPVLPSAPDAIMPPGRGTSCGQGEDSGSRTPHALAGRGDPGHGFRGETPVGPGHRPLRVIEHGRRVELAEALDQPGDRLAIGSCLMRQASPRAAILGSCQGLQQPACPRERRW